MLHLKFAHAAIAAFGVAAILGAAPAKAGCTHCSSGGYEAAPKQRLDPHERRSVYVVNQGPVLTGPGITIPVINYSPGGPDRAYPYIRSHYNGYSHRETFTSGHYSAPRRFRHAHRYRHHQQRHHRGHGFRHAHRMRHSHVAPPARVKVRAQAGIMRAKVVRATAEIRMVGPGRVDIRLIEKNPRIAPRSKKQHRH